MGQKDFTYRLLLGLLLALLIIAVINVYLDTRWITGTVHDLNKNRVNYDERSQKTNFLIYTKPAYNNLILGSSRASYFSIKLLKGKWFNYAASGMYPDEYLGYAQIAERYAKNQKLDTILIGLDFWATCQCAIVPYKAPELIFEEANSKVNQATNLISYDALNESYEVVKFNLEMPENRPFYTLPFLVKNRTSVTEINKKTKLKEQLWYYQNNIFGEVYEFDSNYLVPIIKLIDAFPETHFIFYVSPVSPELESAKTKLQRKADETHWLELLKQTNAQIIVPKKELFGSEMFFDLHHMRPEYFHLISNEL